MEKFCIIENFNNYAISNFGRIKNVKNGKILTPMKNEYGYLQYTFCQNKIKKTFRIHRLVALYFIENPQNKPYVNHIDGDKTNNNVSNLEWCTAKENDEHARRTGLKVQEKPIVAINVITDERICFKSVRECGGILGINAGTIVKILKGKRNKAHGYTFEYL